MINMKKLTIKSLNKKGFGIISEADGILFWLIVVVVVALCAIFAVSWALALRDVYLNTDLEAYSYDARLIYSPQCFAYQDEITGRVYTGTIDVLKLKPEVLNECIPLSGVANYALSAELKTTNNGTEVVLFAQGNNWGMNTRDVRITTYFVNVQGYDPGTLTIFHKKGI